MDIEAFRATAASWQNFYLLVGGAAATLIGLMFVAVTFGSSLVRPETANTARSFLDPTFGHFAQVLFCACMLEIPTLRPNVLGVALLVLMAGRTWTLRRVFRHMREAQRQHADLELSDWISGIVVPIVIHLVVAGTGALFLLGEPWAFTTLVIATLGALLNGLFGAWELLLWMAVTRAKDERR